MRAARMNSLKTWWTTCRTLARSMWRFFCSLLSSCEDKGCAVDNKTPRTMRRPPPFATEKRPKSAGPRRRKDQSSSPNKTRPATRDGRETMDKLEDEEDLSEECKQILKGAYTLNDEQKKTYDEFTHMLADFDLRV